MLSRCHSSLPSDPHPPQPFPPPSPIYLLRHFFSGQDVWLTLTDYDRLAEYVPNLTQSRVKPSNDGQIKLWQEGAQKIVGFDFRASVEMFMDEHFGTSLPLLPELCFFFIILVLVFHGDRWSRAPERCNICGLVRCSSSVPRIPFAYRVDCFILFGGFGDCRLPIDPVVFLSPWSGMAYVTLTDVHRPDCVLLRPQLEHQATRRTGWHSESLRSGCSTPGCSQNSTESGGCSSTAARYVVWYST